MGRRVEASAGDYRLVIYNGPEVTASVYPLSATAYSKPLGTMRLSPWQELPVMEPGAVVHAAENFASLSFGGTTFKPVGAVLVEWPGLEGRIFAERGNVIVNPDTPGWKSTWKSVRNESTQSVERFRRQARRDVWAMVVALVLVGLLVALMVWSLVRGTYGFGYYAAGTGGATGGAVRLGRRARRSLKALNSAGTARSAPARPFKMTLGWAVGHGHGPLAVASLWSEEEDRKRVRHVPVVALPTGALPTEPVDVLVRGSLSPGGGGTIEWGDQVLWPAE